MRARLLPLAIVIGLSPAAARTAAAQAACLDAPADARVDDVVSIRLSPEGARRLRPNQVAYLHVALRQTNGTDARPVTEPWAVRRLPAAGDVTFVFGRAGQYALALFASDGQGWPTPAETGTPVDGCAEQRLAASVVRIPDFAGVHAESWIALRLPYHPELGGAVYFGRVGLAASVATTRSSTADSKWIGRAEIRRRGSRGYLGGGIAYEPRPAEGRLRIKPLVVLGEELPSFRGRPTWLVLDFRLDDFNANFFKDLRVSAAARLDLTRNGRPR
jgi:hypothetical protein